MGFCVEGNDQFDVFMSYAHADNDYHNKWVSDFERYLKEKVIAQLKRQGAENGERDSLFTICRDETGFPESGELAAVIDEKVRRSQFLFIFLGEGYLNSEYCLSELDIFRETAGGTIQDALKRLYLIVLDRKALERLREGSEPARLSRRCRQLWKSLQGISQQAIRIERFLQPGGRLLPVYRQQDRADAVFHEACTPLVRELTERLANSRGVHHPECPPAEQRQIVIGAVPQRLEATRDELVDALGDRGTYVVKRSELVLLDRIQDCFRNARTLIQPFDRFEPVLVRGVGDPKGGHLSLQKELFEKCRGGMSPASDAEIIWWEPPEAIASGASPISEYDKSFIDTIDQSFAKQKRVCSARELAAELIACEEKPLMTARVWIEWEESDEGTIAQAKDIVRRHFESHCEEQRKQGIQIHTALHFGVADWSILERKLKDKPDGIVIVYNENKDFDALIEQEQTISNLEEVLLKKMFPGIFCMRPKGMFLPSDAWRVVRFKLQDHDLVYKQDELNAFVSNLFEVLRNKHENNN